MSIGSSGFGNQAESDITYVDESAVSGFGGDYDYDYYEDEVEDYEDSEEQAQESRGMDPEDKAETKKEEIYINDRKVI